jgi:DNA-binding NarL/FixJ family response regulator
MPRKFTVAIADDHKLFRKGIISMLASHPEIETVYEAENGKELMEQILRGQPDVVLLDLKMPVMTGWEVLAELKKKKIKLPVIVLSMYDEESVIMNAIREGAGGYLSKNAEPDEIFMALESALESGFYFNEATNRAMLRKMLKQEEIPTTAGSTSIDLTDREVEVLRLIAMEMSSSEIATKLFLSPRTVEAIRQKLFEKFGAKNVVGLIIMATKRGFLQV